MTVWRSIHDGARLLCRARADNLEQGLVVAKTISALCPVGYHQWRVEVQRRVASPTVDVVVVVQRNGAPTVKREELRTAMRGA